MPTYKVYACAGDENSGTKLMLAECADRDLAELAGAAYLPIARNGRLRCHRGGLSDDEGEILNKIRIEHPYGTITSVTEDDRRRLFGGGE